MQDNKKLTPVMRQYLAVKEQHPDKIVFFRMGDFFEMFGPDAKTASSILQIQLTARSKEEGAWPMCGIPAHAYEFYLNKLLQAGFKVAICDQVEESSQAKGLVKREVVQTITPATNVHEMMLNPTQSNYIAAVHYDWKKKEADCVLIELSRGEALYQKMQVENHFLKLVEVLQRYAPKEILLLKENNLLEEEFHVQLQSFFPSKLSSKNDLALKKQTIETVSKEKYPFSACLDSFEENFSSQKPTTDGEISFGLAWAAGFLLLYLKNNQKTPLRHLNQLIPALHKGVMQLDAITIKNLEIFQSTFGEEDFSLYAVFNHCKTPMGSRLLRSWFLNPLRDQAEIETRQSLIQESLDHQNRWVFVHNSLRKIGDLERTISRFHMPGVTIGHILKVIEILKELPKLKEHLQFFSHPYAKKILEDWPAKEDLLFLLEKTLLPEPNQKIKEGGFIQSGVNARLDELRFLKQNAKTILTKMEAEERKKSGVSSLKVGYNRIFGYYFEVSQSQKGNIPSHFLKKQTLTNAERYSTEELASLEEKIINTEEEMNQLEEMEFHRLCKAIEPHTAELKKTAESIAFFDLILNLAFVAKQNHYCRPSFCAPNQRKMEIQKGRHPVIENLKKDLPFITNDLLLEEKTQQSIVITGPNMGGKSTYIRQAALIVFLAQVGSFVPAEKVTTCLFDRIFTRVGAMDNLVEGKSTFMVEMTEATIIAKEATNFSFVVIDELGRGTSTFDGIGIAWAILEHLNQVEAFTLFATHYHELTKLELHYPSIKNYHVALAEEVGSLVFLYKILPGGLKKSYGLRVAQLAGMPENILQKAKIVQQQFAENENLYIDESRRTAKPFSSFSDSP